MRKNFEIIKLILIKRSSAYYFKIGYFSAPVPFKNCV